MAGLLVTGNMRRRLKTVQKQDQAASYVRKGSMEVTKSNDFYLYRTVSRTAKPKEEEHSGGSTLILLHLEIPSGVPAESSEKF